jgi:repressor LexA
MLNGNSATVKKYYREKDGRIRLQPANEAMSPMYIHENDISIQGVVVGVLRRY